MGDILITFDTSEYAEELQRGGFTREQAESNSLPLTPPLPLPRAIGQLYVIDINKEHKNCENANSNEPGKRTIYSRVWGNQA